MCTRDLRSVRMYTRDLRSVRRFVAYGTFDGDVVVHALQAHARGAASALGGGAGSAAFVSASPVATVAAHAGAVTGLYLVDSLEGEWAGRRGSSLVWRVPTPAVLTRAILSPPPSRSPRAAVIAGDGPHTDRDRGAGWCAACVVSAPLSLDGRHRRSRHCRVGWSTGAGAVRRVAGADRWSLWGCRSVSLWGARGSG